MREEHLRRMREAQSAGGPPPCAWRALLVAADPRQHVRTTSTCVESTSRSGFSDRSWSDHLHVCGERAVQVRPHEYVPGPPPRVWRAHSATWTFRAAVARFHAHETGQCSSTSLLLPFRVRDRPRRYQVEVVRSWGRCSPSRRLGTSVNHANTRCRCAPAGCVDRRGSDQVCDAGGVKNRRVQHPVERVQADQRGYAFGEHRGRSPRRIKMRQGLGSEGVTPSRTQRRRTRPWRCRRGTRRSRPR